MVNRLAGGLAALCVVLAVSACSGAESSPNRTPPSWDQMVNTTLDVARERGANDTQISIIKSGSVSFDDYQGAVQRTIDCLRSQGIDVVGDRVTEPEGFPIVEYSYAAGSAGRTEGETDAISQQCIEQNSKFVESLYMESPVAEKAKDAVFEKYRGSVEKCLEQNGKDVHEGMSRSELEALSSDLLISGSVDCVYESKQKGR